MAQSKDEYLDVSNPRYWQQNARMAIRDVCDALVEVITNADDRYVVLKVKKGRIEIEVERKRKGGPSIIRVRDFADGMTSEVMRKKIKRLADRDASGLADGERVRGTNSRGAKDVAILGGVTFESIAADGQYHKCEITPRGRFTLHKSSEDGPGLNRDLLRIPQGTGTVVTIMVDQETQVPQHDKLRQNLSQLVVLRDILGSSGREVVLCDVNQGRDNVVKAPVMEGKERVNERIQVPGFPGIEAKLVIYRAKNPLEDHGPKFRMSGILVKSRHAIHEATLFAPDLENDPYAKRFFGKLNCEYIDDLWNEYDERLEKGLIPTSGNPRPIIDPMRKEGLVREHPFVDALFKEALKRLRPLVEEERKQAENQQAKIESDNTRKRLRSLEKAAAKFMSENRESEDAARDANDTATDSVFEKKGFSLNPPFVQLLLGQSQQFWLNVKALSFPELAVGEAVEISCASIEISASKKFGSLEAHPNREGVLRCTWAVRGEKVTTATAVRVRCGPIVAESALEVFATEKDRYADITRLCFTRKRYTVQTDQRKTIRVLAPCPNVVSQSTPLDVKCSLGFDAIGQRLLVPHPDLGVAMCKLKLSAERAGLEGTLTASIQGHECQCTIESIDPAGASIKIELKDTAFGTQRYIWKPGNVLHIAARHPSLCRYLGDPPDFPGQEQNHYRVLLAEIVAEAVCSQLISHKETDNPGLYEDVDWQTYYADYTSLMTKFLPIAHDTQVKV